MKLFADIVLFMVVAMSLGIGIGFFMWRWRRHTVSREEWDQQCRQLEAQAARLNELSNRLRAVSDANQHNGEDARRRREVLQSVRLERDRLAGALELAQHDAVQARHHSEELSVQLKAVERRLAELSINQARARLSGVRRGEQPIGVPAAAERARPIELPGSPATSVGGSPISGPPPSIERPPRTIEAQPIHARPMEARPIDVRHADVGPAEVGPADGSTADVRPAEASPGVPASGPQQSPQRAPGVAG
ncbi:MAG: hypothetical protein ACKV2O_12130 [Acidimicrobiales bacterium]